MKQLAVGILAHVDAGKTTLSEALLYQAGTLRRLGRVDHGDTLLDSSQLERERGITIFSKQARFSTPSLSVTLLDTPGHLDFSAEAERTLQVLDCAILVVSGTDGVQSHTETLWRLLAQYRVPVFIFVNKMDLENAGKSALLKQLNQRFSPGCVDMTVPADQLFEALASCDEALMEEWFRDMSLSDQSIAQAVGRRSVFPCLFGSALKLEGVSELLQALSRFAPEPAWPQAFGARVYKISQDEKQTRLTHLKVTGGELSARQQLKTLCRQGEAVVEKVNQIRLYSGPGYTSADRVTAGTICIVTGLVHTFAGQGLGFEADAPKPVLLPVMSCEVLPKASGELPALRAALQCLSQEEPQLHFANQPNGTLTLQVMGEVQLQVLMRLLKDRFGLSVTFGPGKILYRETIASPVEGIGHFEPLRHYAEVHLLLEPLKPGSGLQFAADCPPDQLSSNWQKLVLSHLAEKEHVGVLTGSPITDLKITLIAGKAHLKHTEGGDFRQATYRALRQGLRSAQSVLLEPWYRFTLRLGAEQLGRAMNDLTQMGAEYGPPDQTGSEAVITGEVSAAAIAGYALTLAQYSRGKGQLSCTPNGYKPCREAQKVIEQIGYDPDADPENTADSVFCSHGAGHPVRWDQVPAMAHIKTGWNSKTALQQDVPAPSPSSAKGLEGFAADEELIRIFERTYGPIRRKKPDALRTAPSQPPAFTQPESEEYLLVDGYNIIFAWEELAKLAADDLEAARSRLIDILCNYQGFRRCRLILVFDAYKVKGNPGQVEHHHNIDVVYTKEAETADMYIEKVTHQIGGKYRVRVATSDGMEQLIILGHGAMRLPASLFLQEVQAAQQAIRQFLEQTEMG